MAREFWEVFLPEDITVLQARYDGSVGEAFIKYCYPNTLGTFKAKFIRIPGSGNWVLDTIESV